ncbi:hypothetical protein OIE67_49615 [Nonomuraea fuscirosea]|nr:hypothetical protein [Nonomuraea fuscirosea]WSA52004.1 hypothetical protein OIE67_49615 [Nonomuraea fuscirosea]
MKLNEIASDFFMISESTIDEAARRLATHRQGRRTGWCGGFGGLY